jgi:putative FmdB family regulatory protein
VSEPLLGSKIYDAMPIYEYDCKQCGVFEVSQRITENPLTTCPKCNSDVRRLISLTSFVLKGSGWYATDYARSNEKSDSSSDSSTKEATSGGDTDKAAASSSESAKTTTAEPAKSTQDKSASTNSAV